MEELHGQQTKGSGRSHIFVSWVFFFVCVCVFIICIPYLTPVSVLLPIPTCFPCPEVGNRLALSGHQQNSEAMILLNGIIWLLSGQQVVDRSHTHCPRCQPAVRHVLWDVTRAHLPWWQRWSPRLAAESATTLLLHPENSASAASSDLFWL